jgi:hypothetical protein
MAAAFIGHDLAKSVFQIHDVDAHGKVVITKHRDPARSQTGRQHSLRPRNVQVTASGRELLLQDQGISPHRDALRRNRHQLRRHDPPRWDHLGDPMNVNRPSSSFD